jgi:hypothetical protein
MTPAAIDDPATLRHILTRTTGLLLDFDGPVCSVFAGLSAQTVVNQLCLILADGGYSDPPAEIEKNDDPFQVLAYAATLGHAEAWYVNAAFTAHELEAIATAQPTPAAHDLIRNWSTTGRPFAIVSNNNTVAIHAYLDLHNLRPHVTHVSARTNPDPTLLKPNPHLTDHSPDSAQCPRNSGDIPRRLCDRHRRSPCRPDDVHRLRQQTPQDRRTHDRRRRHRHPHTSYLVRANRVTLDVLQLAALPSTRPSPEGRRVQRTALCPAQDGDPRSARHAQERGAE